jgi:CheY-like chemotaxis protein
VLDLMLPGVDGVEVCRQLRTFTDAYVVMLTARTEEVDKLIGLSVGADDCNQAVLAAGAGGPGQGDAAPPPNRYADG